MTIIYELNNDILLSIINFLNNNIINKIAFIKKQLLNLDILFLKRTNKLFYNIIENYYKHKYNYCNIYVINDVITKHYVNITKTLYWNEINKIGNLKMFDEIKNFQIIENYIDIVNNACISGHLHILDWFEKYNYIFKHQINNDAIILASKNGHLNILKWFKNYKNELKYINTNILELFKKYGYHANYYNTVIKLSSQYGHIHIL